MKKNKARKSKNQVPPSTPPIEPKSSFWSRLWLYGLILVVAGVGTWALFEYVIWSKIPPELVGKWVVQGGPQDGATLDFSRNGTMKGSVNVRGTLSTFKARVRVEGDKLISVIRNPDTDKDYTWVYTIRQFENGYLVLEDKRTVLRMIKVE